MNVREYLEEKGFNVVVSGENLTIDCPFCDDNRKRFGIHKTTGKWNCFNCSERGKSIISLQKKLDGVPAQELKLPKDPEEVIVEIDQSLAANCVKRLQSPGRNALSYLQEVRGFSLETIQHFQLGSWKKKGYEYVSIPFWKRGKLVNVKFRSINYTDKKFKWRRTTGGESSLFHDDVVDLESDTIYITEAELDCVALWNAGIKNVIAVTTGAKSFKQEWYDRLKKFKKIYLVYDSDIDGQSGAEKAASRLGFDRCYNIKLPVVLGYDKTDANIYFWDEKNKSARHSLKDFKALAKTARKFEVRDTISLRDAIKEVHRDHFLADEDELIGLKTPWRKVNTILGGAKGGHFVVVSGGPKIGKTTFALNWMRYLAVQEDVACFLYECEMKPKRVAEKLIAMESPDFTTADELTEMQLAHATLRLPGERIYFGYPQSDELTLDNVCERIKEAVQRYGIKFVCFDNLHFLVRSQNVKDEIGIVTRRFKLLAETLNIVFVLIVHPRKIGNKEPTPDDLKDSSSIYQDLDTLIFLHRQTVETGSDSNQAENSEIEKGGFENLCRVIISGRWCEGGRTMLYFEGRRALFHEEGDLYNSEIQKFKAKQTRDKDQKFKGRRP